MISLTDRLILRVDKCLKALILPPRPSPSSQIPALEETLSPDEKKHSAALMRINHSGEVCAQALYLGQAWVANAPLAEHLYKAAEEEKEHLRACRSRIKALGGRTSLLNPLWAVGSLGIGMLAGLAGDKVSLGFVAETEKQVSAHLERHLNVLSPKDTESLALLARMKREEEMHAEEALQLGGQSLPFGVKRAMQWASKIMTFTARYV